MEPADIIHWLQECSKDHGCDCQHCPYNKDDYEAGCGRLLTDAALLIAAAYGKEKTNG